MVHIMTLMDRQCVMGCFLCLCHTPGCLWPASSHSLLTTHPPRPPCDPVPWGHSAGSPGSRWLTPRWCQRPPPRRPRRRSADTRPVRSHCLLLGGKRAAWSQSGTWAGRHVSTKTLQLVSWTHEGSHVFRGETPVQRILYPLWIYLIGRRSVD